ncbi:MAG: GNAT family N-acetyltransferase [Alteromonas sp.]|jgi:ribosomal protein S18 acetylase RimI-like enzyme|uniref:GNAT family N-acetyltransferase n=1 Tax=Alteromonas sp. TaxID=232 RepID=UPI0032D932B6
MEINIRPGVASDAPFATPLILSAAESLLNAIFGHSKDKMALGYLDHAWQLGGGQYGFENHWVAEKGNQILGLVTAWHSKLGTAFDRATLDSITSYFTLDEAITVVMRNQTVAVNLTPPSNTELMIGHLAVSEDGKRQGIGRSLVDTMLEKAVELQKRHIVLDVEVSNIEAIRFYQSLGFNEEAINKGFIRFYRSV